VNILYSALSFRRNL